MGTEHLCSGTLSCHVFGVQRPSDAPMSQLTGPQGPKEIRSENSGRGNGFSSRQVKLIRGRRGKCSENFFVKLATKKDQH